MFDITLSFLITACILIWILPILGTIVRLTSPGPAFFIQKRTGRHGRTFRCIKLRTMTAAPSSSSFKQTAMNDPRVTPFGKWLRKTNLDELPQFINVFMGDMSIVGPRPHAIEHDAEYWNMAPHYPKRYSVKPGITGLAQIRGARGITDNDKMKRRLRYDLFYLKKASIRVDVKICYLTVKKMFDGDVHAW
ncbi:sugar transferase [Larkinella soli]|uniref:sugar transferase n=1 Tax=Larkinella soli TaxID=1770527 RepID=UPI000FFB1D5B|nr:sugar transferase [Larkinella soli]